MLGNIDLSLITGHKILILGDLMVDTYHIGSVRRISPEAPVPVIQVKETYSVLGGAANVARNLITLKNIPHVIGIVGNDINGSIMKQMFDESNIKHTLINTENPTITKTRIIGNHQQIARIDFEKDKITLTDAEKEKIIETLKKEIPNTEIVIISDYGKGVCSIEICKKVIELSNKYKKIVIIDPKGNNWEKYSNADIITPNLKELSDIYGQEITNEDQIIYNAAKKISNEYNIKNILVTRSELGMSLISNENCTHIRTEAKEVYDVSGAGDTVVATLSACLAGKLTVINSIKLANKAAGIVVGKIGTSPISYEELQNNFNLKETSKIINPAEVKDLIKKLRNKNKKIVFTNGCFDILHKGHVYYLQKAKELGDILILGLNSDSSVKRLKGETRPINKEIDRAYVLEALSCIDYIIIFDEDTPYNLIKEVMPDILVKGGDYKIENVVGREFAKEVTLINFQEGYSTTNIIKNITHPSL